MRVIPAGLAAEFASGATTLCRCWKATCRDGAILGFTDHDRDIAFDSVIFKAATGLEASEAENLLGLAVGGGEVAGALQADAITEADIAQGKWDRAAVETWLVDWRDVSRRMLLDAGQIGEIRRRGESFTAEVRSFAHSFDQERGRRYQSLCAAEFGDMRCGLALSQPAYRIATSVTAVADAASFSIAALPAFGNDAFTGGTALFTSGSNAGVSAGIMGHSRSGPMEMIALWSPPVSPIAVGQAVTLTVGCDKHFATCRDRFSNMANFRGFPHLPGNDFVMTYARQGDAGQDGGLVRS
jgi:uncharacterized phage protein (TIGR02218 family)